MASSSAATSSSVAASTTAAATALTNAAVDTAKAGSLSSANGGPSKPVEQITQAATKEAGKTAKPREEYQWKNNMIATAGVLLTLGLIFFALTAAGVLPIKAAVLGGVPAASALAFATGVAAIIAFVCRYSCNPPAPKETPQPTSKQKTDPENPTVPASQTASSAASVVSPALPVQPVVS